MLKEFKKAFTLAEVLIVIGIIGVVAALTLPNLNHATGDKEKVTRVKKIYSTLSEAVDRAQAIYGPFDTWFNDLRDSDGDIENMVAANERFAKRVTEFMKVSKDCGFGDGCFSNAPLLETDNSYASENYLEDLQSENDYMVALADGISLAFYSCYFITVDIDGPNKGKNQKGNDIFGFGFDDNANVNQLYPDGIQPDERLTGEWQSFADHETSWVIENGNLDYLKCPDELNWETKTSCK